MELLSAGFLSALLAIIMIDLVLAGDNAIVIALAARNLPPALRTKAIVWGTAGAILVRTLMTLIVVWLLKIPGLMLVGGLLLIWIAYKLLADSETDTEEVSAASGFWGAMRTIVVADAVMGLDNVLAVAGAAHGSFLLVVIGLLISVPIMIGGSQIILRFVERFPVIIYIGSGILAWTAATMIVHEAMLKEFLLANTWFSPLLHTAILGGVLGAGYWTTAAVARRSVKRHVLQAGDNGQQSPLYPTARQGVRKVLVPVDTSGNSLHALRHVAQRVVAEGGLEVHLLHIRSPFSQHISRFLKHGELERFHRDEAAKNLVAAKDMLDHLSIPYATHVELGDKPQVIQRIAQRLHVDEVVIGTARQHSLTRVLEDTDTHRTIELLSVPVSVVAGPELSRLEKVGVPVGVGAALTLLVLTAE